MLLFDVDGTLLSSGGAGARALKRAVAQVFDREEVEVDFSFAGMTDPAIFRRILHGLGLEHSEMRVERILAVYPEILRDEVSNATAYRAHAGVVAALERVAGRERVALGLGTGNIEVGARIKLEPLGLNPYFGFGGYGSDAEDRPELLRAGARRGAAQLGCSLEACRVVVIGDTPRDVAAAHAIGAPCLAVATGGATADALREAGADHLVADLREPGAVEFLLEG